MYSNKNNFHTVLYLYNLIRAVSDSNSVVFFNTYKAFIHTNNWSNITILGQAFIDEMYKDISIPSHRTKCYQTIDSLFSSIKAASNVNEVKGQIDSSITFLHSIRCTDVLIKDLANYDFDHFSSQLNQMYIQNTYKKEILDLIMSNLSDSFFIPLDINQKNIQAHESMRNTLDAFYTSVQNNDVNSTKNYLIKAYVDSMAYELTQEFIEDTQCFISSIECLKQKPLGSDIVSKIINNVAQKIASINATTDQDVIDNLINDITNCNERGLNDIHSYIYMSGENDDSYFSDV
jgi:hypothetical protein